MAESHKKRRLDQTVAAIHKQFGAGALQRGGELSKQTKPESVSTGFAALDLLSGCGGMPLKHISLLSGKTTSGKLTVAYKVLSAAQQGAKHRHLVAIISLNESIDPDYIARCGVALDRLLIAYPQSPIQAVDLVVDLLRTGRMRALLVDSLADISADTAAGHALNTMLPVINAQLMQSHCALIMLDEPHPPWRRFLRALFNHTTIQQVAALHIQLEHEQKWLERLGEVYGYRAQATLIKSRWATSGRKAAIEITFNGTVRARSTW